MTRVLRVGCALVVSTFTAALGCHRVVSGVDPEPLGYGPAQHRVLASGYDIDPVPRATPTPWTPPERPGSAAPQPGGVPGGLGTLGAAGPVAFTSDVIRVCEHLAAQGPSASPSPDPKCLRRYRVAQVFRSIGDWKTLVACLATTTDDAGVAACTRATPASVTPSAEHPHESAACMHLFALSVVEELGPEPMLDRERLAAFGPLLSGCVDALVTEERAKRGPTSYMAMLACVEAAPTTAVAELCAG